VSVSPAVTLARVALRRIWARELQALAEGRPTKRWRHPATGLMPKTGAVKAAE